MPLPTQTNSTDASLTLTLLGSLLALENIPGFLISLPIIYLYLKIVGKMADFGHPAINEFAREIQRNARRHHREKQVSHLLSVTNYSETHRQLRALNIPHSESQDLTPELKDLAIELQNLAAELTDPITQDWIIEPVTISPNDKQLFSRNTLRAWEIQSQRFKPPGYYPTHPTDGTLYTQDNIKSASQIFETKAQELITGCQRYERLLAKKASSSQVGRTHSPF